MAADSKVLGQLHEQLTQALLTITRVRMVPLMAKGEPVLDPDGQPIMIEQAPTAAEMAAAATFLKQNNITAVAGESDDLKQLQQQLAERRRSRAPVLPDFDGEGLH